MNALVKTLALSISAILAFDANASDATGSDTLRAEVSQVGEKLNIVSHSYPDVGVLRTIYEMAFRSGRLDAKLYVKDATETLLQSTYDYLLESGLNGQPENIVYPSEAVMVEVYHQMLRDKHFQMGTGPVEPNLTREVMMRTFEMALALGIVDSYGAFQDPSMVRTAGMLNLDASTNKWGWSATCKTSTAACALSAAGAAFPVVRACGAAYMQMGANAASDVDCAAALAAAPAAFGAVGGACVPMVINCTHRDNPANYESAPIGLATGTTETKYCPGASRAHAIHLRRNTTNAFIRGIRLDCATGTDPTFGTQSGGVEATQVCNNDFLAAGFRVATNQAGNGITSIGTLCDRVGRNSNESGDSAQFPQFGGVGGTPVNRFCPEHQYIIGLRTRSANGIIHQLTVYCK